MNNIRLSNKKRKNPPPPPRFLLIVSEDSFVAALARVEFSSLHLSNCKRKARGRKSRHGAFLITQIYTEPPPPNEEPSEFSEQGKPGGKAVAREPRPSSLLSPVCRAPQFACFPRTVATPSYKVLSLLADSYFTDAI